MKTILTILALLVLSGCKSPATKLVAGVGGYSDTVAVARQAGHNYQNVVEGCVAKQAESMHTFFWLSKHAGFDAASSEGHAALTGDLLRHLGDKFFGECLAREDESVQNQVRDDLLYDLGYGNTDITLVEIKKQYPKTFPKGWTDNN